VDLERLQNRAMEDVDAFPEFMRVAGRRGWGVKALSAFADTLDFNHRAECVWVCIHAGFPFRLHMFSRPGERLFFDNALSSLLSRYDREGPEGRGFRTRSRRRFFRPFRHSAYWTEIAAGVLCGEALRWVAPLLGAWGEVAPAYARECAEALARGADEAERTVRADRLREMLHRGNAVRTVDAGARHARSAAGHLLRRYTEVGCVLACEAYAFTVASYTLEKAQWRAAYTAALRAVDLRVIALLLFPLPRVAEMETGFPVLWGRACHAQITTA
jgi:hypothetical protein